MNETVTPQEEVIPELAPLAEGQQVALNDLANMCAGMNLNLQQHSAIQQKIEATAQAIRKSNSE